MDYFRDWQSSTDEDFEKYIEDGIVSQPNQNTTLTTDDWDLQAAFLFDEIQFENLSADHIENENTQPALLNVVLSCAESEILQHVEPVEDISNTFGASRPITATIEIRTDKTAVKVKNHKKILASELEAFWKLDEPGEPKQDIWEAPSESAELIYNKEKIHVNVKDFNVIQYLGQGNFGSVNSINITGHPDVRMAVKRIILSTKEERASVRRTELKMMQEIGSGVCPYIIDYYGAMIDTMPFKPSTIQGDMWALGISLLEIVIGKHPCLAPDDSDQYLKIATWNPEVPKDIIGNDIREFILHLLNEEVKQRPRSYTEILNMSFIRDLPQEPTSDECIFVNHVIQMSHEFGS
ncbi:unnamed protein product [Rotaria sordida]|uniref:mitogen-activated protein kinase kinase n=1 Tax=Rotaria sordida TaxID=392033 RepID=A0A818QUJ7_9BILA|nr:unnamed protein product [Rotaria sordida]